MTTQGTDNKDNVVNEFISMCTFPYDPAAQSSCNTDCAKANPDDHAKCVENYKQHAKAPTRAKSPAKKSSARGKNKFGHLVNSQADLIDKALLEGDFKTVAEIAEIAGARVPRTRHHILHLKKDIGIMVYIDGESKIIIEERFDKKTMKVQEFK